MLPARPGSPTIRHLGVVPEHRGRRHVDDLVTEALWIVAEAGETRISDTTDADDLPMAASFRRCGYRVDGSRLILT